MLWLLYKASTGGSLDTITSMLSSSHEYTALVAAQILPYIHDQEAFFDKLIDIFDLLKSQSKGQTAKRITFQRGNTSQWMEIMSLSISSYDASTSTRPDWSPTLQEYNDADEHLEACQNTAKELLKNLNATRDLDEKNTIKEELTAAQKSEKENSILILYF